MKSSRAARLKSSRATRLFNLGSSDIENPIAARLNELVMARLRLGREGSKFFDPIAAGILDDMIRRLNRRLFPPKAFKNVEKFEDTKDLDKFLAMSSAELVEWFEEQCEEIGKVTSKNKDEVELEAGPRYDSASPQEEGRAAGDTHVAEDLRHDTHATEARAETTQPPAKQLSSHELRKFLAYAKAHPWDSDGDVRPSDHIKKKFAKWLKLGLSRTDIVMAQENLAQAYATEISRDPTKRVKELVVRPHTLPPGAKRALSARLVSELTAEELEIKRAIERDKKQRQRQRHRPPSPAQK